MRLKASIHHSHAMVDALIYFSGLPNPTPISLLVDTGATNTCLLPAHVIEYGIDHDSLPDCPDRVNTADSIISVKLLHDVELWLPMRRGLLNRDFYFQNYLFAHMRVIQPRDDYTPPPLPQVHSILGMDILQNFTKWKWNWDEGELVMDE